MKSLVALFMIGLFLAYCGSSGAQEETTDVTPSPTPSAWFECPEINGIFSHPYDCQKYFVCDSNNAWMFRCPGGLYFDEKDGICDYPENVDCKATPT